MLAGLHDNLNSHLGNITQNRMIELSSADGSVYRFTGDQRMQRMQKIRLPRWNEYVAAIEIDDKVKLAEKCHSCREAAPESHGSRGARLPGCRFDV